MTTSSWQRVRELEKAADQAFMIATDGFGTEEFPALLAAYDAAMKEASAMRRALQAYARERVKPRAAQRVGEGQTSA